MLILLEGPDCAGKSGLARKLADAIRARSQLRTSSSTVTVVHKGAPAAHPLYEYAAPLLGYVPGAGTHLICDRWHVGESVYPDVLGRPSTLDAPTRAWLELFLLSRGAYLVQLTRDDRYLRDCMSSRGDDLISVEHVSAMTHGYDRAFANTLLPSLALDDSDPSNADVRLITDGAMLVEQRATDVRRFTTYVGPPRPSLLLVGDRRGVAGDPADHGNWPAFVPFGGTSGHYLASVLTREPLRVAEHGTLLSTIGIVNANDVDDVTEVWEAVGRPRVVALGVAAAGTLRTRGISFTRVPHPQYWRRFRHHEPEVYLRRILAQREPIDA